MQLTKEQVTKLADFLVDTNKNVFLAITRLGLPEVSGDEVFDQLEVHGGIFKCERCGTWLGLSLKSEDFEDTCELCAEDIEEDE